MKELLKMKILLVEQISAHGNYLIYKKYYRLIIKRFHLQFKDMRIKKFICIAFLCHLALISFNSCSKDDIQNNVSNEQEENKFKKLSSVNIENIEGIKEEIPETRTPGSINANGKPTQKYFNNYVNLLSLNVKNDLTPDDEGKDIAFDFAFPEEEEKKGFVTHHFNSSEGGVNYDVYYKITEESTTTNGSNKGIISLATDENGKDNIDLNLTVFEKDELKKIINEGDKLTPLNNFDYSVNHPIGSVLFYLTYDPRDVETALSLPMIDANKYQFLTDEEYPSLYNEYEDNLYVSKEILIAATNENIYIFETIRNNVNSGYRLLRKYNRTTNEETPNEETHVHRTKIDMSRLTSIVNASIVINDTYQKTDSEASKSYFVYGNEEQSYKNYKTLYGVDLKDSIECLYATIDGVPSMYKINDRSAVNTYNACRMVLWAQDLEVKGIDGETYDKLPEYCQVDMVEGSNLYSGLGIKGKSFSVCFKGNIQEGSFLRFYTTIAGQNVLISTEMKEINLLQNTLHQMTLLVDAKTLADTIIKMKEQQASGASRANSNDFVELRVPSENLIIN